MWSDMLFTLAAKNSSLQSYYDQEGLPIRVQASIPESVSLVFWDYYHTNASVYEKKIAQHRELGREPW